MVQDDEGDRVAGVSSGSDHPEGKGPGIYGLYDYAVRVSSVIQWIRNVTEVAFDDEVPV